MYFLYSLGEKMWLQALFYFKVSSYQQLFPNIINCVKQFFNNEIS